MTPYAWQLQIALAACRAARLLGVSALVLALYALTLLTNPVGLPLQILATFAVLALLPALYLGLRLEIDRFLFQRLADALDGNGDEQTDLAALDQALEAQGWKTKEAPSRPLADRVTGVLRLMKALGGVVGVQVVLVLLASLAG
jgi:hypothetical protein